MNWSIAVIAAATMVATDVLGVIMVQAEARNRGWLAGWCDTAQWYVGITTTTISVTAFSGHSFSQKVLVGVLVGLANLFGTKLGQVIGSRYVRDKSSLVDRVSALERTIRSKGHS